MFKKIIKENYQRKSLNGILRKIIEKNIVKILEKN
jgi:hypothetical protein